MLFSGLACFSRETFHVKCLVKFVFMMRAKLSIKNKGNFEYEVQNFREKFKILEKFEIIINKNEMFFFQQQSGRGKTNDDVFYF